MSTFRMGDLLPLIQQEAIRQGVSPELVIAHFIAENTSDGKLRPEKQVSLTTQGINPETGKPSGALGLFQVVPTTLQGLINKGMLPAGTNYSTLEGQITAGVAAVREAQQIAEAKLGRPDLLAGAAQYVNGSAGLAGYTGQAPMPKQAGGYLEKIATALGMPETGSMELWGREARQGEPVVGNAAAAQTGQQTSSNSISTALTGRVGPAVDAFKNTAASNIELLRAMGAQVDSITTVQQEAVGLRSNAEIKAARTAAQTAEEKLRSDKNILAMFGLDPAAENSKLIANLAAEAQATQAAEALKPAVDSLMALNPLTNPVKWIAAQFQLGSLVPQYNAAIQNRDRARNTISEAYDLATKAKTITPAITVDTIHRDLAAKTQLAEATAKADAAKYTQENLNARARFLSEEMQWLGQAASLEAANLRLRMDAIGIAKDEEAKAADQARLDHINEIRLKYGAPPIRTWKEFQALPREQQEALINSNSIAASPGEAVKNVLTFGDLNALGRQPGNTAMAQQIYSIRDAVRQQVEAKMALTPSAKPNDVLEAEINKQYGTWRKEIADGDMTKAAANNPYRIDVEQAAKAPGLETNSIAKWALETTKSMPSSAVKEKEVLAQATAQVASGVSVDKVAQEVADFYAKGYEYQFKSRGLGTLGFEPNLYKDQKYYGVHSNIFGFFDRLFGAPVVSRPINLMNPTDVKHFLIQTEIKAKQLQSGGRRFPGSNQDMVNFLSAETGASQ